MPLIEKKIFDAFSDALAISLPHVATITFHDNIISFRTTAAVADIFSKMSSLFHIFVDTENLRVDFTPVDSKEVSLMNHLLLVTRLDPKKIDHLARSAAFRKLSGKFSSKKEKNNFKTINNLEDAVKIIFSFLESQKMSQKQLSDKTGLSQVTLSSLKKGSNIKFENFLQICDSLGLRVAIQKP